MIPGVTASGVQGSAGPSITELFSDADGTNLNGKTTTTGSKTWTVGGGAFDCNTGKGRPTSVSGSAYATIASGLADFDMSCDVTVAAGAVDGLLFRLVDASNYWRIDLQPTKLVVIRAISGAEVGSNGIATTITAGVTYTVRVVCVGFQIDAYLNGALHRSVTDGTHSTATKHGIIAGSTGTRFDNLSVT